MDLLGDLVSFDAAPATNTNDMYAPNVQPAGNSAVDLLSGTFDSLQMGGGNTAGNQGTGLGSLTDMFATTPSGFSEPKAVWLSAAKGKGLEITGTFSLRQNAIYMDMTFTNNAMQAMGGFAVQFNKNRFISLW